LRKLEVQHIAFEDFGEFEPGDDISHLVPSPALYPLLHSANLGNVRVLQLGTEASSANGEPIVGIIKLMPRLEELYLFADGVDTHELFGLTTLNRLRILQMYHNRQYALQWLAKNPSLGQLTHLLCHPHALSPDDDEPYIRLAGLRAVVHSTALPRLTHLQLRLSDFGDEGCNEIVASGVLNRLQLLDLYGGRITDKGAVALARWPDLRRLEWLNLDRNRIGPKGVEVLTASGVKFTAVEQWGNRGNDDDPHDWDEDSYLSDGDWE
jgi:hypothetical protein